MSIRKISFAGLLSLGFAGAALADAPADKFVNQINDAKNNIQAIQDQLGGLMDNANQIPLFTKQDQQMISVDVQKEIALWNSAAAAWAKGDQPAAEAATAQARTMGGDRGAWQQRLDWRQRQAREAPTEDALNQMSTWRYWTGVAAYFEAKKRLSEACGKMADSIVPGVDPQTLAKLDDEIFNAQLETDIAEMRMSWASEDHGYAMRDAVSSPGLTAAQQALNDQREKHVAMVRKIRAEQRELDKFDKGFAALSAERDRQAELARQQRDHPDQK